MINYQRLKLLRTSRKFTLQEMADALGLETAGGYLRVETGENKLKAEHLPLLADKFGIKLDQLINEIFFSEKLDECSTLNSSSKEAI